MGELELGLRGLCYNFRQLKLVFPFEGRRREGQPREGAPDVSASRRVDVDAARLADDADQGVFGRQKARQKCCRRCQRNDDGQTDRRRRHP